MDKSALIGRYAKTEEDKFVLANILDKEAARTNRSVLTGTKFMTEHWKTLGEAMLLETGAPFMTVGGYPDAERCIFVFLPDYFEPEQIEADPSLAGVTLLSVTPDKYFKEAALTHRDYLGALLALGIERDTLGDILVAEGAAQLICLSETAAVIQEQLTSVGRCKVYTQVISAVTFQEHRWQEEIVNVSSLRLDAVVAAAFRISRSEAVQAIERELVTVSGVTVSKCSAMLTEGDRLSLRGKGKVRYDGIVRETKKERLNIRLQRYL